MCKVVMEEVKAAHDDSPVSVICDQVGERAVDTVVEGEEPDAHDVYEHMKRIKLPT